MTSNGNTHVLQPDGAVELVPATSSITFGLWSVAGGITRPTCNGRRWRMVRRRTKLSGDVDDKTKRPRLESHEALRRTALPQGLLNLNLSSSRISVNHYGIRSEYACTVTSVCRGSRALTSPCRFRALNLHSSHQANLEG